MPGSPAPNSRDMEAHERFMDRAMELARLGRGPTAPNPCVGSVLVRGGEIVAQGRHRRFGGPHAERECLADARAKGVDPSLCTLYVTLEPCNHHGKTPPCTEAVLEARIPRVVVGALDPNPVAQGGAERLREAGVDVLTGVRERECLDLIRDFSLWRTSDRAYCILKMASTLDGRIAARTGRPEAVSSPESFQDVHRLRALADAVIVGGNTFLQDDPSLTCRLAGQTDAPSPEKMNNDEQPYAVVLTTRLPGTDCDLQLIRKRPHQTIFWTTEEAAESDTARALEEIGVRVWGLPHRGPALEIAAGLTRLHRELGAHYALCEGGGRLAMRMLEQGCADEFVLYLAPRALGDERGVPLLAGRDCSSMAQALNLRLGRCEPSGPDLRLTYYPD
ncbi:bifunctional diaminohydroxyphosphoribosylaminopyrimidine deaminase/5-amino-6-(5-phosphoribosylamino)uracil reductase RibD [Paucidesulfovibrio longus]|uniref:bifunctional diaminohydroxyphosphoribosylaminopyrimidine deaminase/5-amino-6-(5-phosphoribosylamino)uracil reductase RibD n=1 Tax=Paucidesulfovibrio longus TaxID=889 RepID=UPI0003B30A8A|nr:bifunctional diaminohydroxyphosphoribosylaminopyrimidine deaminase/5-amino-6-(5-phosphoribosylamino)uracil reductase RibD [Paucidesulfovibrio longus]